MPKFSLEPVYSWKRSPLILLVFLATAGCVMAKTDPSAFQVSHNQTAASLSTSLPDTATPDLKSTPDLPDSSTLFTQTSPASTSTQGQGLAVNSGTTLLTASPTPSMELLLSPDQWQEWPIIPTVSQRAIAIYRQGLAMGNNPKAFSKVGDCQNITNYFLGIYDDPKKYRLGSFEALQATIDQFKGSFERNSLAVKGGFNVAAVLNPIYADPAVCGKSETPLACELRINKPSIVIISMETWWAKRPASTYENYLRQIVDYSIQQGALPILATKADNLEGDGSINASIARVAREYDIPLWNFWLAVQPLPYHGLTPEDPDHFHITGLESQNLFDDPQMMKTAWPVRNLTALQALDTVYRAVSAR